METKKKQPTEEKKRKKTTRIRRLRWVEGRKTKWEKEEISTRGIGGRKSTSRNAKGKGSGGGTSPGTLFFRTRTRKLN